MSNHLDCTNSTYDNSLPMTLFATSNPSGTYTAHPNVAYTHFTSGDRLIFTGSKFYLPELKAIVSIADSSLASTTHGGLAEDIGNDDEEVEELMKISAMETLGSDEEDDDDHPVIYETTSEGKRELLVIDHDYLTVRDAMRFSRIQTEEDIFLDSIKKKIEQYQLARHDPDKLMQIVCSAMNENDPNRNRFVKAECISSLSQDSLDTVTFLPNVRPEQLEWSLNGDHTYQELGGTFIDVPGSCKVFASLKKASAFGKTLRNQSKEFLQRLRNSKAQCSEEDITPELLSEIKEYYDQLQLEYDEMITRFSNVMTEVMGTLITTTTDNEEDLGTRDDTEPPNLEDQEPLSSSSPSQETARFIHPDIADDEANCATADQCAEDHHLTASKSNLTDGEAVSSNAMLAEAADPIPMNSSHDGSHEFDDQPLLYSSHSGDNDPSMHDAHHHLNDDHLGDDFSDLSAYLQDDHNSEIPDTLMANGLDQSDDGKEQEKCLEENEDLENGFDEEDHAHPNMDEHLLLSEIEIGEINIKSELINLEKDSQIPQNSESLNESDEMMETMRHTVSLDNLCEVQEEVVGGEDHDLSGDQLNSSHVLQGNEIPTHSEMEISETTDVENKASPKVSQLPKFATLADIIPSDDSDDDDVNDNTETLEKISTSNSRIKSPKRKLPKSSDEDSEESSEDSESDEDASISKLTDLTSLFAKTSAPKKTVDGEHKTRLIARSVPSKTEKTDELAEFLNQSLIDDDSDDSEGSSEPDTIEPLDVAEAIIAAVDDDEDTPALNEQQFLEKCNDNIKRSLLEADSSTDEDEMVDDTPTTTNIEDHLKNTSDEEESEDEDEEMDDDASSSGRGTGSLNNSNTAESSSTITATPAEPKTTTAAKKPGTVSSEGDKADKPVADTSEAGSSTALQVGIDRVKFSKNLFDMSALDNDDSESDTEIKTLPLPLSKKTANKTDKSSELDLSMLDKPAKTKSLQEYLSRANDKAASGGSSKKKASAASTTATVSDYGCISLSSDSEEEEAPLERTGEGEGEGEGEPDGEEENRRGPARRFLTKDQLAGETKVAQRAETERIKRLEKKQERLTRRLASQPDVEGKQASVLLDYDTKRKMNIVIHAEVVKSLKEHQIEGCKFMYDACYGSVDDIEKHPGSGCILAHCMGLGKTLQLIALLHTVIRYPQLKTKKVLVICPKSTVMNWGDEIRRWLGHIKNCTQMKVFTFPDHSDIMDKVEVLEEWNSSGEVVNSRAGCLLVGYEAFRSLVFYHTAKKRVYVSGAKFEKIKKSIRETLLDPGADLVVCDEGHMIKNRKSATYMAVSQIQTRRRIVLTGTPIQNNLKEYYCMVNFIKPSFLGTEKEFANLYANPIKNGQHKDSTGREIVVMKQRSFVLHKKLSKFVQRREPALLKTFLPEKYEYVLFIPISKVQERLYEYFLANNPNQERYGGKSLIPDYTGLRKIWTHPKVLESAWENACELRRKEREKARRNNQDSEDDTPDDFLDMQSGVLSVTNDWWRQHLESEDLQSLLPSNKLRIMFDILMRCEKLGEKCLIFSAFVAVLNVVEYFMKRIHSRATDKNLQKHGLEKYNGPWVSGADYYRLDGKTPKTMRHELIKRFNDPNNRQVKCFLISAKAGGQGINLTGANRVIILDTSWNPSNDQQNIFRIFRLGQKRKCFVYRLLAMGTMEEKVYSRSVTKQAMSFRVVDEQQIDRHYSMAELAELYTLTIPDFSQRPVPTIPADHLLTNLLHDMPDLIYKYHEHDSLLENKLGEDLSDEEKADAWAAYEREITNANNPMNMLGVGLNEYNPDFHFGNMPLYSGAGGMNPYANYGLGSSSLGYMMMLNSMYPNSTSNVTAYMNQLLSTQLPPLNYPGTSGQMTSSTAPNSMYPSSYPGSNNPLYNSSSMFSGGQSMFGPTGNSGGTISPYPFGTAGSAPNLPPPTSIRHMLNTSTLPSSLPYLSNDSSALVSQKPKSDYNPSPLFLDYVNQVRQNNKHSNSRMQNTPLGPPTLPSSQNMMGQQTLPPTPSPMATDLSRTAPLQSTLAALNAAMATTSPRSRTTALNQNAAVSTSNSIPTSVITKATTASALRTASTLSTQKMPSTTLTPSATLTTQRDSNGGNTSGLTIASPVVTASTTTNQQPRNATATQVTTTTTTSAAVRSGQLSSARAAAPSPTNQVRNIANMGVFHPKTDADKSSGATATSTTGVSKLSSPLVKYQTMQQQKKPQQHMLSLSSQQQSRTQSPLSLSYKAPHKNAPGRPANNNNIITTTTTHTGNAVTGTLPKPKMPPTPQLTPSQYKVTNASETSKSVTAKLTAGMPMTITKGGVTISPVPAGAPARPQLPPPQQSKLNVVSGRFLGKKPFPGSAGAVLGNSPNNVMRINKQQTPPGVASQLLQQLQTGSNNKLGVTNTGRMSGGATLNKVQSSSLIHKGGNINPLANNTQGGNVNVTPNRGYQLRPVNSANGKQFQTPTTTTGGVKRKHDDISNLMTNSAISISKVRRGRPNSVLTQLEEAAARKRLKLTNSTNAQKSSNQGVEIVELD